MAQDSESDRIEAKLKDINQQEDILERAMGPRAGQMIDRVERLDPHGGLDTTEEAIRTETAAVGGPAPDEGKIRQMADDEQKVVADNAKMADLEKKEADLEYEKQHLKPEDDKAS